ncbi:hypothetical protein D3C81_2310170 [compost metagenome]
MLSLEAQPCAQTDQFQQVGTDTPVVSGIVKKGKGGQVICDQHTNHRLARDPQFFAAGEL